MSYEKITTKELALKTIESLRRESLNCNVFSVYDYNCLSMQELLCKFFEKINQCVDATNKTVVLVEWLVENGLKEEVAKKLDIWLKDGTLAELINEQLLGDLLVRINAHGRNILDFKKYNEGDYWDNAIIEGFKVANRLVFPRGRYKFRNRVLIEGYFKCLDGCTEVLGGTTVFVFEGNDAFYVNSGARYCNIKNIKVEKNTCSTDVKTGVGLRFGYLKESGDNTINHCTFENLNFIGFNTFIETSSNLDGSDKKSILWNCTFKNIRADHCTKGIKMIDTGFLSFNNLFEQIYINGSENVLELKSLQANFLNCNFGISAVNAFDINNNCYIKFDGCNFECDTKVNGTGGIFNARAKTIEFDNCIIATYTFPTVNFFNVFSTLTGLSFSNMRYDSKSGNEMQNFWSSSNCDTAQRGAVKFLHNTVGLPRPTNWSGIYTSRYMECNYDIMIDYDTANNGHNTQGLKARGEYVFGRKEGIPLIHNGTEVTDFMGNSLNNTTGVYKISNGLYVEKGRVTFEVGSGLKTVHFTRRKKGVFITSPCTFKDGSPPKRKYMVQMIGTEDYYDKNDYVVLRGFQWDDDTKTWSENITESFNIDWVKFSD